MTFASTLSNSCATEMVTSKMSLNAIFSAEITYLVTLHELHDFNWLRAALLVPSPRTKCSQFAIYIGIIRKRGFGETYNIQRLPVEFTHLEFELMFNVVPNFLIYPPNKHFLFSSNMLSVI